MHSPEQYTAEDNEQTPSQTAPPPQPQIPWEDRKQIGSFHAYWRTAKMVMFRPAELEQFLDTPACEKHAKKFRRVTVQLTFMITLLVFAALLIRTFMIAYGPGSTLGKIESSMLMTLVRIAMAVLSLIALFLATRSLEWFCSPKAFDATRQDRAISLSCYACAPILIVTIVGSAASLVAIMIRPVQGIDTTLHVINLAWLAIFLIWWPASVRAIHFTTGRSFKRSAAAAILLPLIWLGQQLLIGIIPMSMIQWFLIGSSIS